MCRGVKKNVLLLVFGRQVFNLESLKIYFGVLHLQRRRFCENSFVYFLYKILLYHVSNVINEKFSFLFIFIDLKILG